MKHILNDLTDQEKNAIREQHTGGMKVITEKFSKLTNSKLGDVKLINEQQEVGKFKEGPGDPQTKDFDHYNKIVKPQLLAAGFKDDYNKNMQQYGTENSLSYGGHNNGVNAMWDRIKGFYVVWVGNNKGLKRFQLGPNDPKLVANNVVKYALSLKGGTGLNEDSHHGTLNHKQNASEMYHNNKRKLEQAIHLLEDSAKKGEDTSHFHMIIKMALREMDSYVQDLMK